MSYHFFVIEYNDNIVGLIIVKFDDNERVFNNECEILAFYIMPEYWRRGIGTYAISFLTSTYKKLFLEKFGFDTFIFTLWVMEENVAAVSFYKKNGFYETGNKEQRAFGGQNNMVIQYVLKS